MGDKFSFKMNKSDKVKFPTGMNYFYVQSRNSRYYFCKRCFEYVGIYHNGTFSSCPIYSPKYQCFSEDLFFPEECPHCYIDFSGKLACERYNP